MLGKLEALPKELGRVEQMLADSGYLSKDNVERCAAARIEPLIALGRERHHVGWRQRFAAGPSASPKGATPLERMAHRLQTPAGSCAPPSSTTACFPCKPAAGSSPISCPSFNGKEHKQPPRCSAPSPVARKKLPVPTRLARLQDS